MENTQHITGTGDDIKLYPTSAFAVMLMIFGNLIPLIGVVFWGWTVTSVLVLYWIETVIIGIMNVPRILATGSGLKTRVFIALFFIVHFGGFCYGHAFFLKEAFNATPVFDSLFDFQNELSPLLISAIAFFISHLFGLIISFFGPVKYRDREPNVQVFMPYGRIFIMQFVVLIGGGFVQILGAPIAALIILILLKTGLDWVGLRLSEKYTLLL